MLAQGVYISILYHLAEELTEFVEVNLLKVGLRPTYGQERE